MRINETKYPQPRRVTWSVAMPGNMLFAYTQFGRKPEDFRCRPMPLAQCGAHPPIWHGFARVSRCRCICSCPIFGSYVADREV